MNSLQGKVAIITGAGSGIGRAAALLFAREGARVVVADLSEAAGGETVSALRREGGEAVFVAVDVAEPQQVRRMVDKALATFGHLDVLVNNAGIDLPQARTVVDTEPEIWDRVLAVNLKGAYLGCKYALPVMVEQRRGAIVNTASIGGIFASPANAVYSVSKAGVIMLTKQVALDYARFGIRSNCVCPGVLDIAMTDYRPVREQMSTEERQALAEKHPMGRFVRAEDVAQAMRYLASDQASYVTGHALAVDGGFLIGK